MNRLKNELAKIRVFHARAGMSGSFSEEQDLKNTIERAVCELQEVVDILVKEMSEKDPNRNI